MILNFNTFINEKLKLDKLDSKSLFKIKDNLVERLNEYKEFILSSIKYDMESREVKYVNFENIDIPTMMRELKNEFGEEMVDELNIETFLRKIYQIIDLRKKSTKKNVRDQFIEFFMSLDKRVERAGREKEPDTDFGEFDDEKLSLLSRKEFESEKYDIQVELMKLQEWVVKNKKKVAIVFEGRDAAGKGSTIKRFTEYLNPKGFRVVALGVPTEEEKNNWFGRYEKYLPNEGEIVFFDRSWYNRGVVEPAMGYCTKEQYTNFIENVLPWEESLIDSGTIIIKLWFSITKEKQLSRFEMRQKSPLKYWKFSPNDAKVVDKWDIITKYKNQMFSNTSSSKSPWVIVNSNDKRIGMLNAMRYVLWDIDYDDKNPEIGEYYPEVINIIK